MSDKSNRAEMLGGLPMVLVRQTKQKEDFVNIPTVQRYGSNDILSPRSYGSRSLESSFGVSALFFSRLIKPSLHRLLISLDIIATVEAVFIIDNNYYLYKSHHLASLRCSSLNLNISSQVRGHKQPPFPHHCLYRQNNSK